MHMRATHATLHFHATGRNESLVDTKAGQVVAFTVGPIVHAGEGNRIVLELPAEENKLYLWFDSHPVRNIERVADDRERHVVRNLLGKVIQRSAAIDENGVVLLDKIERKCRSACLGIQIAINLLPLVVRRQIGQVARPQDVPAVIGKAVRMRCQRPPYRHLRNFQHLDSVPQMQHPARSKMLFKSDESVVFVDADHKHASCRVEWSNSRIKFGLLTNAAMLRAQRGSSQLIY